MPLIGKDLNFDFDNNVCQRMSSRRVFRALLEELMKIYPLKTEMENIKFMKENM
jgi:hypothetical protein